MSFIKNYYITNELIGRGSFASVYKASDTENQITYAVKKISIKNKNHKKILENELNLLRNLHHINIINIHDILQDKNNTIYLVLDYYKLGDLSNFLNGKMLKEKYCQKYTIQLKNGLEYLYRKKIIHRDLKPQNILVSDSFILKITDFGFAKYFTNNMMINTLCGSPLYMAPEIIKKSSYNIKSDLWSLGIIIYEMLNGTVPFKGKNIIELERNIDKKELIIKKTLSKECKYLIEQLLKDNPNERCNWEFIFNYSWLNKSNIETIENNLLEISFNSIPDLNKLNYDNNENQFNSFKYKSIYGDENNSLEFNFNLNNTDDIYSSSDDSFKSCEEVHNEEKEENLYEESFIKNYNFKKSKPINIENNLINNKKYSNNTINSYVIISKENSINQFRNNSFSEYSEKKKKSLSASFKEYLNSSLHFVKQSYEYISNSSL